MVMKWCQKSKNFISCRGGTSPGFFGLEDCEEVWIGELSEYMLETHKRQKQVQVWFDASVLVKFHWYSRLDHHQSM